MKERLVEIVIDILTFYVLIVANAVMRKYKFGGRSITAESSVQCEDNVFLRSCGV